MPKCPKGFRWDAKAKRCVPKGGSGRQQGGGTAGGNYETGGDEDENVYIGVPSDYRAVGGGRYKPVKRGAPNPFGNRLGQPQGVPRFSDKPIYKEGGEYRQLAGYSPDAIFQIQSDLVYLGLLEEEGWIPGVNDPKTAAAFKKVLATANTQAREWQDVLPEMVVNTEAAGMGPGEGEDVTLPPFVFEPTPGVELGADLTDVAGRGEPYSGIGREASDVEKLQFAQEYQGQEYGAQRAGYEAESEYARAQAAGAPGGGEVTLNRPPAARVAAEEWLKKNRPREYQATRAAGQAAAFEDLLLNSRWRLGSG